jgi:hypothetical protein
MHRVRRGYLSLRLQYVSKDTLDGHMVIAGLVLALELIDSHGFPLVLLHDKSFWRVASLSHVGHLTTSLGESLKRPNLTLAKHSTVYDVIGRCQRASSLVAWCGSSTDPPD